QLQRLKDRLGPDGLKKAGLTDKDWDEFMKNAAAYEQLLRSQKADANPQQAKGQKSVLPTTSVRPIGGQPEAQVDPLLASRPLPPPEFREAQSDYTKRLPK